MIRNVGTVPESMKYVRWQGLVEKISFTCGVMDDEAGKNDVMN